MKNKSSEGIIAELNLAFPRIAFWFETTMGIPHEIFIEEWMSELKTVPEQLYFYMSFRNKHPKIFENMV